jgi:hypothetical protein
VRRPPRPLNRYHIGGIVGRGCGRNLLLLEGHSAGTRSPVDQGGTSVPDIGEILGMLDRDGALHLDDVGDTGCGPSQDLESLRFRSTSRH